LETILLIDDDVELCSMLSDYLGRHGYKVAAVHNGKTGLEKALSEKYSIVLLDVMLPGLDGFEVLRRIRTSSTLNVLLLTARGEDIDRIVGLEIGADDYLPKPFNPRELLARIRAILRRSGQTEAPQPESGEYLEVMGLELDASARTARCAETTLDLTDVEFTLLQTLMRSPGEVVDREHLTEVVLQRKFHPFDRSLDMHVSRLRRKLEEAGNSGDMVKTIRGIGYQLAVPTARNTTGDL
jgi:DNA-binding response OmpR family regulator